jgi:hypothetical protein
MPTEQIYEDLDIGDEQVSSNECWEYDDFEDEDAPVYSDLKIGYEQVTSNECYNDEEEE